MWAAPSHARQHDAPKRGPICHAVAFSSLFACRNVEFSSILRAILHTTDIDQRPALACEGVAKRDPLARRAGRCSQGIFPYLPPLAGLRNFAHPQQKAAPLPTKSTETVLETMHDSFTVVPKQSSLQGGTVSMTP